MGHRQLSSWSDSYAVAISGHQFISEPTQFIEILINSFCVFLAQAGTY